MRLPLREEVKLLLRQVRPQVFWAHHTDLTLSLLGWLCLARGLRLNRAKTVALNASQLQEGLRDGHHSIAELMKHEKTHLGRRHFLTFRPFCTRSRSRLLSLTAASTALIRDAADIWVQRRSRAGAQSCLHRDRRPLRRPVRPILTSA